jgi:hypothetical protein
MVDAVNSRLDEKDQFSHLGWHPMKTIRLRREYRRMFPDGRLIEKLSSVAGAQLVLLLALAGIMKFPLAMLFFLAVAGTAIIVVSSRL